MSALLGALDLWKLLRGVLAGVATLVLTLILAGAFAVAAMSALLSTLQPGGASPGAGGGVGPSASLGEIPPDTLAAVQRAAGACPGLPWPVLAGLAKVESGFDPRAVGPYLPQFAGTEDEHALGMMQFLPSTYRFYVDRVDALTGKGLGMDGIWDAESALYAAALYLCDNGAPGDLRRALFAYNRADWYVDEILALATAYGLGGAPGGPPADVVAVARQYLGWPYVWGGASPETSFDCSGLTQWSYRQVGVGLPRTAQEQFDATQRLDPGELQPGDLVFFAQTYPDPANWITHVGIYVGDGQMIHAPHTGSYVHVQDVYWEYYVGAARPG